MLKTKTNRKHMNSIFRTTKIASHQDSWELRWLSCCFECIFEEIQEQIQFKKISRLKIQRSIQKQEQMASHDYGKLQVIILLNHQIMKHNSNIYFKGSSMLGRSKVSLMQQRSTTNSLYSIMVSKQRLTSDIQKKRYSR